MRLRSIKLSGFKSFVDPTVIPVRSHMNAVVGPNGCGKSNIVDAVRWVIGETSAKQLRGQSMADVIFNGTTSRKPVGKAGVELLFDNSEGRLVGEYARFSEISIRREVERDGVSSYFINGVASRRRDIVDIFLGTGLGARSYAIIEQGMISRLIEAKPEEMRAHLEEAAGISKYKERRRETENRIRHTRENLDRLNDLLEEITKQLRHLKRQSNAAKRYNELKDDERLLQAQIKALSWSDLDRQLQQQQQHVEQQTVLCDEKLANQRRLETEIEHLREEHVAATQAQNEVQKNFYGLGSEIARLEQQLQHHEEQQQRWQQDLEQANNLWEELTAHIGDQQGAIQQLNQEVSLLEPQTDTLGLQVARSQEELSLAETAMADWRQQWDTLLLVSQQTDKQVGVLQNNIVHYERERDSLIERSNTLRDEKNNQNISGLKDEINPLEQSSAVLAQDLSQLQEKMDGIVGKITHQRQDNAQLESTVNAQRREFQQWQARFASLEALQQTALGGDDRKKNEWLQSLQLTDRPKLAQQLKVNTGWELALETVMRNVFDAICINDLESAVDAAYQLEEADVMLLEQRGGQPSDNTRDYPTLLSQVASDWPLESWLSGVYIAETIEEAKQWRSSLGARESVITRDGIWLGSNWLRVAKTVDSEDSILLREQELQQWQQRITVAEEALSVKEASLEQGRVALASLEVDREAQHQHYQRMSSEVTEVRSQLSAQQSRLHALLQQQQRLVESLNDCEQRREQLERQLQNTREELGLALDEQTIQAEKRKTQQGQRERVEAELEQARQSLQREKQQADEVGIRLSANESQLRVLEQTVSREQRQIEQLKEKREQLTFELSGAGGPVEAFQQQLQEQLSQRVIVEECLHEAEDRVQGFLTSIKKLDDERASVAKSVVQLQEVLQQYQIERQTLSVRRATFAEQLKEMEFQLEDVLQQMPAEAELNEWEQRLAAVAKRVERLGPINLAAIDEYKTLNERKEYLDQQHADITEALELLEGAIGKIDRETRAKFRDTYEKVNAVFQTLFPRIFGGGRASLELTENDYLTAGIQVIAQPPGKRNTTIHMLSGGEKSLTAIALVFAMFELNPAPFCILDEVDAPLDDVNVGRFCQLVKSMSTQTQFLLISHNKVTIGMADHMMGVTMQEAGVSRIVSVDMEEAIAMVDA